MPPVSSEARRIITIPARELPGVLVHRLRKIAVNPRFWQWFHGLSIFFWLALFPPGLLLWPDSVPFLMFISLATALLGSLAGFGAALGARKADPDDPL